MSNKPLRVTRNQDKMWMSEDQMYKGIMEQAAAFDTDKTRVVLVAHFPSTFRALESLLQSAAISHEGYSTPFDAQKLASAAEYESPFKVMLTLAGILPLEIRGNNGALVESPIDIKIIVAGHHPLPKQDDLVADFAKMLPYNTSLIFHEALDGALMKFFKGDKIRQLMASLNVPENQPVSSISIDKTVGIAQEKLARRVPQNLIADSADQWFQINLGRNE